MPKKPAPLNLRSSDDAPLPTMEQHADAVHPVPQRGPVQTEPVERMKAPTWGQNLNTQVQQMGAALGPLDPVAGARRIVKALGGE